MRVVHLHLMSGLTNITSMDEPKTIKELRDFFASIPEDKWCKGKRGMLGTDIHCAVGHMVHAFNRCHEICGVLRIPIAGIIHANDFGPKDPKTNVLEFINKYISD